MTKRAFGDLVTNRFPPSRFLFWGTSAHTPPLLSHGILNAVVPRPPLGRPPSDKLPPCSQAALPVGGRKKHWIEIKESKGKWVVFKSYSPLSSTLENFEIAHGSWRIKSTLRFNESGGGINKILARSQFCVAFGSKFRPQYWSVSSQQRFGVNPPKYKGPGIILWSTFKGPQGGFRFGRGYTFGQNNKDVSANNSKIFNFFEPI